MRFSFSTTFVAVCLCFFVSNAQAQSLFSNSGNGSLGTTNTGGRQTNTQGAQGQSTSGINTGQTLGTTNLNAADGSLSATVGQGGFVGGQNSGTFVGNRFAGQGSTTQSVQPRFTGIQQGNRTQNRNTRNTQANRRPIRPIFRMSFSASAIPAQQVQANLAQKVVALPKLSPQSQSVAVDVDEDGIAILTGTVASEYEKKRLESYVRMEPGIRGVTSELTITTN